MMKLSKAVRPAAVLACALALAACNGRGNVSADAGAPSASASAGAGGLADGTYDCGGGYEFRAMGKVDIQGGAFRFRPLDQPGGDFAPYSVAGGKITWGGHFGGLDDPPAKIVESAVEPFGFNVNYQTSAGALSDTMSCHAPGK